MEKISRQAEENYLEFVKENIEIHAIEGERMLSLSGTVTASGKDASDHRSNMKKRVTHDPENPYFIRIDLQDGHTRYYGFNGLKQYLDSDIVSKSHPGVSYGRLILGKDLDGKGYISEYPENLPDMVARTRFTIKNGNLLKIDEDVYVEGAAPDRVIAAEILESVLQETRESKLQPIASTLQPDQFRITREPATHLLAIQGPPGSGKTAVLLERLSRIAFADESIRQKGMLLVGPNAEFMEYVSNVLPTLGKSDIELLDIDALSPFLKDVSTEIAVEDDEVIFLKGHTDMITLVDNAVSRLPRVISSPTLIRIQDITLELRPSDSFEILSEIIEGDSHNSYIQKRSIAENRIKNFLTSQFLEAWTAKGREIRQFQGDLTKLISQESAYKTLVKNMFPNTDPINLLFELKNNAQYFLENAEGVLDKESILTWMEMSDRNIKKLTRSDLPVLDYIYELLVGKPKVWGHIAIDEAQDLSPMQLRMLQRRLGDGATISLAGDLAQATGAYYYSTWEDVIETLGFSGRFTIRELNRSYRVPKDILEYATKFLDYSKVSVNPSQPFLDLKDSIKLIVKTDQQSAQAEILELVKGELKANRSVLLLARDYIVGEIRKIKIINEGPAIFRIMNPKDVKGLEFDTVIIAEPLQLLEELNWTKSRLARLFYVLTTRSTKRLILIGNSLEALQNPFEFIPEEEEEDLAIDSDILKIDELVILPAVENQEITEDLGMLGVQEQCANFDIFIPDGDSRFSQGYWFFIGTSQLGCSECHTKPLYIFRRHYASSSSGNLKISHLWALVCTSCLTISDKKRFEESEIIYVETELSMEKQIEILCPECQV
jgi:DNA helicase IV